MIIEEDIFITEEVENDFLITKIEAIFIVN